MTEQQPTRYVALHHDLILESLSNTYLAEHQP
jgi:hypothetical protein